jgi:hypothetical protein
MYGHLRKLMKTFYQFYEEMMAANAAGTSGGFGADSPATGPTAGYGKKMKKPTILARGLMPGARKRWTKKDG